jgi:DNA-binding response OmpR family regulator
MSGTQSILMVGTDEMLLATRTRILEGAGFRVVRARDLDEAEHHLRAGTVSLLILCYTLPPLDCRRALTIAQEVAPHVRTLALTAPFGPCIEGDDVFVEHVSGPLKLIETVKNLLS